MKGIYVVSPRWDGPCKIGITNTPAARIKQLMIGSCVPLSVSFYAVYAGKVGGRFKFVGQSLEGLCHKKLTECDVHRHGEWFDISVPDAVAVIKKCAEMMGAREVTLSDLHRVDPTTMENPDLVNAAKRRMMREMAAGRSAEAAEFFKN